jgi:hypothetical protein
VQVATLLVLRDVYRVHSGTPASMKPAHSNTVRKRKAPGGGPSSLPARGAGDRDGVCGAVAACDGFIRSCVQQLCAAAGSTTAAAQHATVQRFMEGLDAPDAQSAQGIQVRHRHTTVHTNCRVLSCAVMYCVCCSSAVVHGKRYCRVVPYHSALAHQAVLYSQKSLAVVDALLTYGPSSSLLIMQRAPMAEYNAAALARAFGGGGVGTSVPRGGSGVGTGVGKGVGTARAAYGDGATVSGGSGCGDSAQGVRGDASVGSVAAAGGVVVVADAATRPPQASLAVGSAVLHASSVATAAVPSLLAVNVAGTASAAGAAAAAGTGSGVITPTVTATTTTTTATPAAAAAVCGGDAAGATAADVSCADTAHDMLCESEQLRVVLDQYRALDAAAPPFLPQPRDWRLIPTDNMRRRVRTGGRVCGDAFGDRGSAADNESGGDDGDGDGDGDGDDECGSRAPRKTARVDTQVAANAAMSVQPWRAVLPARDPYASDGVAARSDASPCAGTAAVGGVLTPGASSAAAAVQSRDRCSPSTASLPPQLLPRRPSVGVGVGVAGGVNGAPATVVRVGVAGPSGADTPASIVGQHASTLPSPSIATAGTPTVTPTAAAATAAAVAAGVATATVSLAPSVSHARRARPTASFKTESGSGDDAGEGGIKRGQRWTVDEDRLLYEVVAAVGCTWGAVCSRMPGRTARQCSDRCVSLSPCLSQCAPPPATLPPSVTTTRPHPLQHRFIPITHSCTHTRARIRTCTAASARSHNPSPLCARADCRWRRFGELICKEQQGLVVRDPNKRIGAFRAGAPTSSFLSPDYDDVVRNAASKILRGGGDGVV